VSRDSKVSSKRRRFDAAFKEGAVRLVLDEGRLLSRVAKDLDVSVSCVAAWVRQARIDRAGGGAAGLATDEQQELAQLRKEVRELRVEREILKKAAAFFAKENA